MVITESELREMWRDGKNPLPPFPPGTTFTPAALDFFHANQVAPRFIEDTPPGAVGLPGEGKPEITSPAAGVNGSKPSLGAAVPSAAGNSAATAPSNMSSPLPAWDKPGSFPVVLSGPIPICIECGRPVHKKPEHMTQLDASHFAAKTHPRIKLRGQLDTLHALVMLVAAEARHNNLVLLATYLDTLAAYCREIQSAEYNNQPVGEFSLAGKTAQEIHAISHQPDKYLGISHLVPGPADPSILHWLNYLRTTSRQVEISALEVYPPPNREDLAEALNRFSSSVYYLELLLQSKVIGWNNHPFNP